MWILSGVSHGASSSSASKKQWEPLTMRAREQSLLWLTCIFFLSSLGPELHTLCCVAWLSHPCPFALRCHLNGSPYYQVLINCTWRYSSSYQVECCQKLHLPLLGLKILVDTVILLMPFNTYTLLGAFSLPLFKLWRWLSLLVSLTHIWFGFNGLNFFPSSGPWLKGFQWVLTETTQGQCLTYYLARNSCHKL